MAQKKPKPAPRKRAAKKKAAPPYSLMDGDWPIIGLFSLWLAGLLVFLLLVS